MLCIILRVLGNCLAMTHVQRNMLRFTTTGQMFRKLSMLIQQAFLTDGLLAGPFEIVDIKFELVLHLKILFVNKL